MSGKQTLLPIVTVLLAAAILMVAFIPLQNSGWADEIRTRPSVTESSDPLIANDDTSLLARIVRPLDALLKVALFMGIPGLIARRLTRRPARRPARWKRRG